VRPADQGVENSQRSPTPPSRKGVRVVGTRRGSPPSLLLLLFGDYWLQVDAGFPSAALVTLLADFGVNDAAARAALSRMVKRGLLSSSKSGRTTAYRVTPRARQVLMETSSRILEFGASHKPWPGTWSLVAFDVPENNRPLLTSIQARLGWLGFAPLYGQVWICPHDRHDAAVAELERLGVAATSFDSRLASSPRTLRLPQEAWDLVELSARYETILRQSKAWLTDLSRGRLAPADALVHRAHLFDEWLDLSAHDPDLPLELLPAKWPREAARELFLRTHDALGDPATQRVRDVVAASDPMLVGLVERRVPEDWRRMAA
jgi:phenylacetic acid degradation operon negative regulatory protein